MTSPVPPSENYDAEGNVQPVVLPPTTAPGPPPAENLTEAGALQPVRRVPSNPPGPPPSDNVPAQGLASNEALEPGANDHPTE